MNGFVTALSSLALTETKHFTSKMLEVALFDYPINENCYRVD